MRHYFDCCTLKGVYRAGLLRKRRIPKGKCETTADHTGTLVMFAPMCILLISKYKPTTQLRIYQLLGLHDFVEAGPFGDIPPGDRVPKMRKMILEMAALENMLEGHPPDAAMFIRELCMEYMEGKTEAAKFAKEYDKIEATLYAVLLSWWYPCKDFSDFFDRPPGFFKIPLFAELFEEAKRLRRKTRPKRVRK